MVLIDGELDSLQKIFLKTCRENTLLNMELSRSREVIQRQRNRIQSLETQLTALLGDENNTPDNVLEDQHDRDIVNTATDRNVWETALQDLSDFDDADDDVSVVTLEETDHSEEIKGNEKGEGGFRVDEAVHKLHKWFFSEGHAFASVPDMMKEYPVRVKEKLDIPLDRHVVSGLVLGQNKLSTNIWEDGDTSSATADSADVEFTSSPRRRRRMLQKKDENSNQKDFLQLGDLSLPKQNRAYDASLFNTLKTDEPDCIRIRACDEESFAGNERKWFQEHQFTDYYALPLKYKGNYVGGMSWSTKSQHGFSNDHLQFFQESARCFTSYVTLHAHDALVSNLHKRLEDEVAVRTRDLEEANQRILNQSAAQLKNFAMMSHEIRTPLNCIIGLSSLLVDSGLDESQLDSMRMIVRSGDLLLSVVNDVLDYSRLESGNIEINLEPTDINSIARLVHRSMSTKSTSRNVQIRNHLEEIPCLVKTDGSRLQQVLYNLLGNAVKFSREGGVVDFAMSRAESAEEKVIKITVKDYGKGIAKKDLVNIFEPFNQGSGGTSRVYGGTGLGLAITAKLVRVLNGKITVDSEEGEWAQFEVTLPFHVNKSEAAPAKVVIDTKGLKLPKKRTSGTVFDRRMMLTRGESLVSLNSCGPEDDAPVQSISNHPLSSEESTPRPFPARGTSQKLVPETLRVMVVDDNKINQKVLVRMLQNMGVQTVDTADNGLEACKLEAQKPFELILMDLEMPVMDGLEATRHILARTDGDRRPKVAFVTAHALDTYHAKAVAAGGCAFLTKPFNMKKLTSLFNSIELA